MQDFKRAALVDAAVIKFGHARFSVLERSNGDLEVILDDDETSVPLSEFGDFEASGATKALVSYAAQKRWQVETGGIVVGGVSVATDDRSKVMIIGARVKADADPNFTTEWKTPAGFQTINAATIIAISDAVLAHVDACFAVEAIVLAEIAAGTITTTNEIDAADWP